MIDKMLLKLREEMGISQETAAKSLNVSRSALGYYERGERQPDASFIIKAADFFGVTADFLLGRSSYRSVENQAIANTFELPISDKAIAFIKSVPPELQPTLDLLLSDPNFESFLLEVMTYIYSLKYGESSESIDIISYKLKQAGTSYAPPEIINRLLARLQQAKVIEALERLINSMVEHDKKD
jgi:transcriptional regulator with XRE-family HTH domain